MEIPNSTTLILDLRDRMARIETKLDGHNLAHEIIDKAFVSLAKRQDETDAVVEALSLRVTATTGELAISKARLATLAAVGSGFVALITFFADHVWAVLKVP